MWPYHPDLLANAVPRYTSYPTAAEFDLIEPDLHRSALENVEGDVSLYVHIPFCETICHYCGCNTGAVGRRHRVSSYLDALHREIGTVSSLLPHGARVRRIAFGGGSPNAIAPTDFVRLVDDLIIRFGIFDPVFSIELDPRTMSADWASVIKAVGIKRASLGVQTFAQQCQTAIGRVQPEEMIAETTALLRGAGVTSLNYDLMYGLPRQTLDDLRDSLQRTVALGADRVALFGYAHVPHIVPRQRAVDCSDMPDQAKRFSMAQQGFDFLRASGYMPVGFDHFVREETDPMAAAVHAGTLHRNFQGFTDDDAPNVIGLGASAISVFPNLLAQNEKNSGRYRMLASEGRLAVVKGRAKLPADHVRGQIIKELLCSGTALLPAELEREGHALLKPFLERELVSYRHGRVSITAVGLPYSRTIAALFDEYRQPLLARFSSAV